MLAAARSAASCSGNASAGVHRQTLAARRPAAPRLRAGLLNDLFGYIDQSQLAREQLARLEFHPLARLMHAAPVSELDGRIAVSPARHAPPVGVGPAFPGIGRITQSIALLEHDARAVGL